MHISDCTFVAALQLTVSDIFYLWGAWLPRGSIPQLGKHLSHENVFLGLGIMIKSFSDHVRWFPDTSQVL